MTLHPICFDATGTLIELNEGVGVVYRRVALAHGVDLPAWRLEDAAGRIQRSAPARQVTGHSLNARRQCEVDWWTARIHETFQATDSSIRFDDFPAFAAALFDAYRAADLWRLREGARGMLTTLRERGCRLAIVSNFDHRLPDLLEGLDLSHFFETIVIPSQAGAAKPDRTLFETASQALETPIEWLTYVGDDAREVLTAIANHGLRVLDVREIADLEALPDLVARAATLPPRGSLRPWPKGSKKGPF